MKDRSVFIAAALESIELIKTYTDGYSLDDFLDDRKTQDAVIRNLEIIGQALKDFGVDALVENMPQMPWHQICGMRNVLAHEYLGVDVVLVWETVQSQLEALQNALENIPKLHK
ncbi:MAG: DUF86 domain-containing protein [Desulfuromonas sp.]|nr:DUF86 domain-containing protein [Desulfuromonas sp.]